MIRAIRSVLVEDPTRILVAAVRRRARRRDSPKSSPRQISTSTLHSDHCVYTTTTITTIILALYYLITATITTIATTTTTTITTTATTTAPVLERTCTRCPGKRWTVELSSRGKFKGHRGGIDGSFRKLSRKIDRDSHETIIYYSHYMAQLHGARSLISRNTNPGLVEIQWMSLVFFFVVFFLITESEADYI